MESSSSKKSMVNNLIQEERDLNNKINVSYPYPLLKNNAKIYPENLQSESSDTLPSTTISGIKKSQSLLVSLSCDVCKIG